MITQTLRIGGHIKLNWHGFDDLLRIIYVFGDTIVAIDRTGKPYNLGRQNIAEYNYFPELARGFYLVSPCYQESVVDDQIIMAGYFTGAYWLLSGQENPLSIEQFSNTYEALHPFTTQNIMRVFDKMLVMLPMAGSGDEVADRPPVLEKPANCRNRMRDEGKPYTRSYCAHCKNGGLMGCPFEKDGDK